MNTKIKREDVETCDHLKRDLSLKNNENKNLFEQKERIKIELKNICSKHEKLSQANNICKGENCDLEKENDVERNLLEKEIMKMLDIKEKQETEARQQSP